MWGAQISSDIISQNSSNRLVIVLSSRHRQYIETMKSSLPSGYQRLTRILIGAAATLRKLCLIPWSPQIFDALPYKCGEDAQ